jgi:tetratricopeptide (TPR) repeat protein
MQNSKTRLFIFIILNLVFWANIFGQDTPPNQELGFFESLNERIKTNPADKEALLLRSEIYQVIGDEPSAIADLTKLITLEPTSAKYYLRRAQIYLKQKDYLKAKADVTKSLQIDSTSLESSSAYFVRGTINFVTSLDSGKTTDSAMPDFNKAIELNPTYADFYVSRGIAFFYAGDNQKSLNDFKMATDLGSEKTDTIEFFRERAAEGAKNNDRVAGLAGRYFYMMENLRQKNLQAIAAVRFSDQTINPVKNARTTTSRRAAAQKSLKAHLSSERFLVASLAEVAKIRQLPFTKTEWAAIQKVEVASQSLTLVKAQSALNTSLGIVRKNISILRRLR